MRHREDGSPILFGWEADMDDVLVTMGPLGPEWDEDIGECIDEAEVTPSSEASGVPQESVAEFCADDQEAA